MPDALNTQCEPGFLPCHCKEMYAKIIGAGVVKTVGKDGISGGER
jgi:hypothetical protein